MIMQNCRDPRLLEAIEASWFHYLKWRTEQLDGEVYDTALVKRVYSGYPLDGVFLARLPTDAVEATIADMITYFVDRHHAFRWYIGPTTTPPNLAASLLVHGFLRGDPRRGMAINLQDIAETLSTPNRLHITRVRSVKTMRDWLHVELTNAGIPGLADHQQTMLRTAEAIGFEDDLPLQRYIGYVGDAPVATSQLFYTDQVARIDAVSALPDVRRRGIGTALSLATLRTARAERYKVAVLWASPMGVPLYRRIGFTDHCEIVSYRRPYIP